MCLTAAIDECADIERQLETVEREIEAARADADSGVTRPGGHGAAYARLKDLSERRDELRATLEELKAQQAHQQLDELVQAAPERTVELEKLAGDLGARAGDQERIIASAEKQLAHFQTELAKALKSDNKDAIGKAQSELNLHQARAQNARATLESIEGERQAIESEIVRLRAAQALETALLEHASASASLGALHAAGIVAERLFRISVSAGRDAAADTRAELAAIGQRVRALGGTVGIDAGLLLECGMSAEPDPQAVRRVLRETFGLIETDATRGIFETLK